VKIKNEFVTNSSSISFIIKWKRPIYVAKQMLKIFFSNWEQDDYNKRIKHANEERILKWFDENPKYEGNIYFPWSCNYETYIYTIDPDWFPSVRVDTCYNENWDGNGLYIDEYIEEYDYCKCTEKTTEVCSCKDPNFQIKFLDLTDMKVKGKKQLIDDRFLKLGYTRGPYAEDGTYIGYPSEEERIENKTNICDK